MASDREGQAEISMPFSKDLDHVYILGSADRGPGSLHSARRSLASKEVGWVCIKSFFAPIRMRLSCYACWSIIGENGSHVQIICILLSRRMLSKRADLWRDTKLLEIDPDYVTLQVCLPIQKVGLWESAFICKGISVCKLHLVRYSAI